MPNFTEKAIKAAFLELLDERPLSKIKVKDIVDRCGINRNSFYYHYADIPALIESVIKEETDKITAGFSSLDSIGDAFASMIGNITKERRLIFHIFNSVSRDVSEPYLLEMSNRFVTKCFDAVYRDKKVADKDRKIIIRHYKALLFGMLVEWLNSGMKSDIIGDFNRLCELKKGHTDEMVERSEKKS